jgi:membrane-associated phospholipid phosphatase
VSRASAATAAALVGAFAALAGLVAAGELTTFDRWAMLHAMPGARFTGGKPTFVDAVVPLWGSSWHGAVSVVTNVVTLPAAFLVATAIVATACLAIRGRAAVLLAAVYVAANAIEEITKTALTRPPLVVRGVHAVAFDNSFPSGHTIRTILIAAAVATAWPRATRPIVIWALCSLAMIEIGALHVPSDIAGGLLLTGALLATAWSSLRRARSSRRRPSPACRPSSRAT